MSQPLRISDDDMSNIIKKITDKITKSVLYDIERAEDFRELDYFEDLVSHERATLLISPIAWSKMYILVNKSDLEIGWHGFVERKNENTFYLKDIVVFPQTVSSVHVDTDAKEYDKWENEFSIDELNSLRLNGHSHVKFGVTPSKVDRKFMYDKMQNFFEPVESEDFFYIFLILNKFGDMHVDIFDVKNNMRYLDDNVNIDILFEDGLTGNKYFEQETKKVVLENESTKKL